VVSRGFDFSGGGEALHERRGISAAASDQRAAQFQQVQAWEALDYLMNMREESSGRHRRDFNERKRYAAGLGRIR
jgi:hypothetical protein